MPVTSLHEARVALAHALWAQERAEAKQAPDSLPATDPSRTLSRARHLPPKTSTQFFGVGEMLVELLGYLGDRDRHWVISLDGMAGLGKTALAREAAGRLAATDRFAERPVSARWHGASRRTACSKSEAPPDL
jgi:hypothetical protein